VAGRARVAVEMYRHRVVLRALLDTLYPALPADAAQAQNAGDQDAAVAFALSASDVPFIVEQARCRSAGNGYLAMSRAECLHAPVVWVVTCNPRAQVEESITRLAPEIQRELGWWAPGFRAAAMHIVSLRHCWRHASASRAAACLRAAPRPDARSGGPARQAV